MGCLVILDRDHLARYTGGDTALEAELFNLFLKQTQACLERLKIAQSDQEWCDAAHTLKGSARGIGAFKLGEVCADAETCATDQRSTVMADLMKEVQVVTRDIEQSVAKCA